MKLLKTALVSSLVLAETSLTDPTVAEETIDARRRGEIAILIGKF